MLAVLVAAIAWYVIIIRPNRQDEAMSPTALISVTPTANPTESIENNEEVAGLTDDQTAINPAWVEDEEEEVTEEATTQDVSPTTQTGAEIWMIPGLLAAVGTGAWSTMRRLRKGI